MNTFDDRKKSFEKKFVRDEELEFKISARKNKYLGEWASKILGHQDASSLVINIFKDSISSLKFSICAKTFVKVITSINPTHYREKN